MVDEEILLPPCCGHFVVGETATDADVLPAERHVLGWVET